MGMRLGAGRSWEGPSMAAFLAAAGGAYGYSAVKSAEDEKPKPEKPRKPRARRNRD